LTLFLNSRPIIAILPEDGSLQEKVASRVKELPLLKLKVTLTS